ncbi:MAG: exodeoxyribonuclease V subunit gamma [Actinomycetota bacterium]|nr:exodeoxyribonuclease V subunit gamma [Actinomycetota bacterium]
MLQLHASGRIEPLALALAEVLSDAPSDPMSPEWIAVPSEGMRRWLSLELAGHLGASGPRSRDGVAANITSAFPGSLRTKVLEAGDPAGHGLVDDPWAVDRLVWSVLDAVLRHESDPLIAPLLDLPQGSSRFGRARRVADLFDRYHVHRPDMICAWRRGDDVDATGRELLSHHRWQPHLWRLVSDDIGRPSPAERLPGLLDHLRSGQLSVDLPQRVMLFGLTLLPGGSGFLELARALGVERDVHLFLLEPSPASARRVTDLLTEAPTVRLRGDDRTSEAVRHPLVRSWGRLHRETTVLVADAVASGLPAPRPVDRAPRTSPAGAATLLTRLQSDIASDRAPAGDLLLDKGDRSVQFHACYGTTRQVEVLRDVILHLLADDELALREDDVLVMCPDLERFAPVIDAVFGPSVDDPTRHRGDTTTDTPADDAAPALRYRIADRSIGSANPVLAATTALLELVAGRFDAPSVLDFVSLGPVRERFRFTDDDLARLADWVDVTNVRWGLHAEQRVPSGVPASITNNTWQAATDRLLLGSAVLEDDRSLAFGDIAPYGIESDDVVLAGRLADLVWRLGCMADEAARPRPVGEWVDLLRANVAALFSTDADTDWQLEALLKLLGDIVESAEGTGGASVDLDFGDLRRLLSDRLEDAPGRPDFFRGGVTISSMTPLRWVPHRAVVLLGMDQSAFGAGAVDGDDLAAATPLLGDRDRRGESRQALLEAVLAARDRLVLIRDGHDVRTNHEVPAAVAVAELRDALLAMADPSGREALAERLEIRQPRQPYDERCFTPGLVGAEPWSFDRSGLHGALARRERTARLAPFMERPFERDDSDVIELAELQSFMKDPVKYFLQRRLGVRLPGREDGVSPLLPVGLDGLEQWQVGDRCLSARLAGVSVEDWRRLELRLGTLPPAAMGDALLESVVADVEGLVSAAEALGLEPGRADRLPVDVVLGDGTRVVGTVTGRLAGDQPGPVRLSFSKERPAYRVPLWLDVVALTATDPGVEHRAVGVYRSRTTKPPVPIDFSVPGDPDERRDTAVAALEVVVDLYRRGTAEPLPIFEYLTPLVREGKATHDKWSRSSEFGGGGDGDKPPARLAFGAYDFDSLIEMPVTPYDPPAPVADRDRRVERFAHVIWHALESSVVDRCAESGAK